MKHVSFWCIFGIVLLVFNLASSLSPPAVPYRRLRAAVPSAWPLSILPQRSGRVASQGGLRTPWALQWPGWKMWSSTPLPTAQVLAALQHEASKMRTRLLRPECCRGIWKQKAVGGGNYFSFTRQLPCALSTLQKSLSFFILRWLYS